MRHTIFLLLLTATANCIMFSQAPGISWQNTIGGYTSDLLQSSQQTSDGGYILGGYSNSNGGGDKSELSMGAYDYWVVKLTAAGIVEWQNTIGGGADDYLFCIRQTTDGGYILAGYSASGITGDKTEALIGSTDYWVIKLNSAGAIEWQNTIGGNNYDYLISIEQTTDGGYILGGHSLSSIYGDKTEFSNGGTDYWIIKLSSLGAIEWQNDIGGTGNDYLYAIHQTTDGGYILGGYSNSPTLFDKTEASLSYDYWVVKLNSIGNIEWQNTIGGDVFDQLYDIQQTADGGYILGGSSNSNLSGDKTEASFGLYDYWIIKLTAAGIIEWQNSIGGSGDDLMRSIQQTSDGGYILGGNSNSGISGDKTEAAIGIYDYWVIRLNSTGSIVWQNTIGGAGDDNLRSVIQNDADAYLLAGYSTSGISGDKTEATIGGAGANDYWVIKLLPDCMPEICNGVDDNCNGLIDDAITESITISAGGVTTFCQGGSVALIATHTGTTLQWKKNGVNIPGATSGTYVATQKATYTCTTTSFCGTTTSTGIYVTVNKNPTASITAGGATTFCAGGSVTLTETPVAGSTYQWYKGASALAGATLTNYIASTAGNYKCRVTKTATGCFKNSNAISVSVPCREGQNHDLLDLEDSQDFVIYPNPNNGTFTISASSAPLLSLRETNDIILEVYNSFGQLIYSQNICTVHGILRASCGYSSNGTINQSISIDNLSSGIYFVRVGDGVYYEEQKLIIE
ncbi:MAG: T9SS type A sorting domain-containing protein [Chitinophagales bacterium]